MSAGLENDSRDGTRPVLILGAGVNGVSVARELLLNGVPVVVVDTADIAFGATSKSSRLIHGGLRYLEYGDFSLVRESLEERERLLRTAPQFVRPLRLHIPVRQRTGGFLASGIRFVGLQKLPGLREVASWSGSEGRGLYTVESGLRFYDLLAGDSSLPGRSASPLGPGVPPVDHRRFRWICSYSDCQMLYPERYVLALIQDCERIAGGLGLRFDLLTYHRALRDGLAVDIQPVDGPGPTERIAPLSIVNATGAWGDLTLAELPIPSPRLFGGTKGTHILTAHAGLRVALRGDAIYAEAADGRLVFILPHGEGTMIGTTDDRFQGRPEEVRATPEDIDYLVRMTNEVFPQIDLTSADVAAHCCGVRPLPYAPAGKTQAIPRGHWIETNESSGLIVDTLIGGKLTTCRALGEEVAERILKRMDRICVSRTRDRPVPGAESYPRQEADRGEVFEAFARETGWEVAAVQEAVALLGGEAFSILRLLAAEGADPAVLPDVPLPAALVRWMIRSEHVHSLLDLIERRTMLALEPRATRATFEAVLGLWREAGQPIDEPVVRRRLVDFYGRQAWF